MVAIRTEWNIGRAREVLNAFRQLGTDPLPLMQIAGSILENSTRDRFTTSHGPGGIPWPISRRAAADGGRTLVNTGGLLSSITSRASSHRVEWGVMAKTESAKHSASHQFGVTIKPKTAPFLVFRGADGHLVFAHSVTLPPRPFLGIDAQDRADLTEAWLAHLESMKK